MRLTFLAWAKNTLMLLPAAGKTLPINRALVAISTAQINFSHLVSDIGSKSKKDKEAFFFYKELLSLFAKKSPMGRVIFVNSLTY